MAGMSFVIYSPGAPARTCGDARETRTQLDETGGVGWVYLENPPASEVEELGETFALPDLAIQDALRGRQRSKLEDYDDVHFLVLRRAIRGGGLAEIHVFAGTDVVICLTSDTPANGEIAERIDAGEAFHDAPIGILYLLLDAVVDSYQPTVEALAETIDEVEDAVFAGKSEVVQRLHELLQTVLRYQRVIHPLVGISEQFLRNAPADLRRHFRDVHDHTLRLSTRIDSLRDLLSSAMQVHIALVGQRQNEEMARMTQAAFEQGEQSKKIASWAAILFTPTVIAGIYGMNFHHMPELATRYGYPAALLAMIGAVVILYAVFKRQRWL